MSSSHFSAHSCIKYFCDSGQLDCGDIAGASHLNIFFPTVISGTIILIVAFFIARWLKRAWLFFATTAVLALMFNGGGETFEFRYELVGALPSMIASVAAWYLGKERNPKESE